MEGDAPMDELNALLVRYGSHPMASNPTPEELTELSAVLNQVFPDDPWRRETAFWLAVTGDLVSEIGKWRFVAMLSPSSYYH